LASPGGKGGRHPSLKEYHRIFPPVFCAPAQAIVRQSQYFQ